jgi:sarcosine oxidase subunit beta
MVAETPLQVAELKRKHQAERAAGLATELIDEATLREDFSFVGPSVVAADYCADDGYVNPLLVVPALVNSAMSRGARFVYNSPVSAIDQRSAGFTVRHARGSVTAPSLVLATGPWLSASLGLLGLPFALNPVAIQMIVTERQGADITPLLVQHIGEGLSLKQVRAGNVLIGGGWPAAEFQGTGRQEISYRSIHGNLAQAARIVPAVRDMRVLRVWGGPLAAARDEMPVAGELSMAPGAYVVGGTYGITFAPLWASLVAQQICGVTPEVDITDLGPDRLIQEA